MTKIKTKKKVEWEQLLFDFDFLKHFGYAHWSELSDQPERTAFLLDAQNRIEIKHGSKFVTRFRANELMNQETLFPLYQTAISKLINAPKDGPPTLLIFQIEKGMMGKYRFESTDFSIDNLRFDLMWFGEELVLKEIAFNSAPLQPIQGDSLVIGTGVIIAF